MPDRGAHKPTLRLSSPLLPLLVGLLLILKLVSNYRGWLILLVGLGGAWLVSYLWSRSVAKGLRFTREMRYGWAQVGDQLDERFTLENHGWAPAIWVEVDDHSTLPGHKARRVTGVGGSGSSNQWVVKTRCRQRGLFVLGPTTIRCADPLGIYTVAAKYPESRPLVVTPPVVPLKSIHVAPAGIAGDGRKRHRSMERSMSNAGLREYLPGDSLRRIHWPTSAHQGSLFVRLLEGAPAGDWWIFVNLEAKAQVGEGFDSTEELGVIIAASLADAGLRGGHNVGLVMAAKRMVWLHPKGQTHQRWRIFQELAQAKSGETPFREVLHLARSYLRQLPSLILVTPPAWGEWISHLLPLLQRGAVATVLLLDPLSFGGEGDLEGVLGALANLRIHHYVVGREMFDLPEMQPGKRGKWEWRVGALGRAIPLRRPKDPAWKPLT